mgnify:CR=1 FL=1
MTLDGRYSRQEFLKQIGLDGQRSLVGAKVLIVGCGALGSNLANLAGRAGFGCLVLVDNDLPELSNLQRQVLFDEDDVKEGLHKSLALARRMGKINSDIEYEPHVARVDEKNIGEFLAGVDLVLDGTDNIETRKVINKACYQQGIPWVYGGVVGTQGNIMPIRPGIGPCFSCLYPETPEPGTLPTADTFGIMNTAPAIIAALKVTEAIKLLIGGIDQERKTEKLLHVELWDRRFREMEIERYPECSVCGG